MVSIFRLKNFLFLFQNSEITIRYVKTHPNLTSILITSYMELKYIFRAVVYYFQSFQSCEIFGGRNTSAQSAWFSHYVAHFKAFDIFIFIISEKSKKLYQQIKDSSRNLKNFIRRNTSAQFTWFSHRAALFKAF